MGKSPLAFCPGGDDDGDNDDTVDTSNSAPIQPLFMFFLVDKRNKTGALTNRALAVVCHSEETFSSDDYLIHLYHGQ